MPPSCSASPGMPLQQGSNITWSCPPLPHPSIAGISHSGNGNPNLGHSWHKTEEKNLLKAFLGSAGGVAHSALPSHMDVTPGILSAWEWWSHLGTKVFPSPPAPGWGIPGLCSAHGTAKSIPIPEGNPSLPSQSRNLHLELYLFVLKSVLLIILIFFTDQGWIWARAQENWEFKPWIF